MRGRRKRRCLAPVQFLDGRTWPAFATKADTRGSARGQRLRRWRLRLGLHGVKAVSSRDDLDVEALDCTGSNRLPHRWALEGMALLRDDSEI